jgi:uncharacterized membrane protein
LPPPAAWWRVAAVGAAIAAYALASHWLMVHAAGRPWAVAVVFGPMVLALAGAGWQQHQPWLLAACAAGVAALGLIVARGGVDDIHRVYLLQHAGLHLVLAFTFGLTLRANAIPLVTRLAESLRARSTPGLRAYTRRVTQVWTGYFLGMVAVSLALYALAPWPGWSFYANVLTPLAAAALFVGEGVLRYRWHPEFERVSLRSAFGAYRDAETADPGPRP